MPAGSAGYVTPSYGMEAILKPADPVVEEPVVEEPSTEEPQTPQNPETPVDNQEELQNP
jgi:hypothetical protein